MSEFKTNLKIKRTDSIDVREAAIKYMLTEIQEHLPHYILIQDEDITLLYYDEEEGRFKIDDNDTTMSGFVSHFLLGQKDKPEGLNSADDDVIASLPSWFYFISDYEIIKTMAKYKRYLKLYGYTTTLDTYHKFSYYNEDTRKIKFNLLNTCIELNLNPKENQKPVLNLGFNKDHRFLSRLNVKYDENAKCDLWLEKLAEIIDDEDDRQLFRYYLGYLLINGYFEWKILLLLYGPLKNNGKTTLIDVIKSLFFNVQKRNLSSIGTRFGFANLEQADFINCDESDESPKNIERIKDWISGSHIGIERKGKDFDTFDVDNKGLAACNEFPYYLRDLASKMLPLGTPNCFLPADDGKKLTKLLIEEKSGIFNWILEDIPNLISNISTLRKGIEERSLKFYEKNLTPVSDFIDIYTIENEHGHIRLDDSYIIYNEGYIHKFNHKIMDNKALGTQIRQCREFLKVSRPRLRDGSDVRTRSYHGISWNFERIKADLGIDIKHIAILQKKQIKNEK